MNPEIKNQFIVQLLILIIGFSFLGLNSSGIIAQSKTKKTIIKKEKKTLETIIDVTNIKRDDEIRDADDDDKSESTEPSVSENPYFKVVVKNGTPLRSKPKVRSKRYLVIPEDTIGQVLEETKEREIIDTKMGNWLKVEYNGKIGWIFSGFTIVKEDKEDFLPLTLIGYFLIKSKEPIFYRKPGREILGVMPNYPKRREIVPVYKKKTYYENDYYFFELKSTNPKSEEVIVSWVGAKSGNFLSSEAFSAYTLRSRKKKLKSYEIEMVDSIGKLQSVGTQAVNYANVEIQRVPFKGKSRKKKAYIVGYPTGSKTKSEFGNFEISYYLVWKGEDNYKTLLAGDKNKLKIEDIDKDGNPEIIALFENKGEPPLCHIYTYRNERFEQLFPNYLYCDSFQILPKGIIEIQKEKEKIQYKYSKGELELIESTLKPIPTPIEEKE